MYLTDFQKKEIEKAINEIEFGEITIKSNGKTSVDIIISNRKRIFPLNKKNYKKG